MTETDFGSILSEENAPDVPVPEFIPVPDEEPKRRTRRMRSDAGKPRGTRTTSGRKPSTAKIAENLLQPWAMVAQTLGPKAPTASAVLIQRGEMTCTALVEIASTHPKMMRALENLGKFGPSTVIAQTVIEVVIATQLDFGRLPPEHPIAYALGLTHLYIQVHPEYNTHGQNPTIPAAGPAEPHRVQDEPIPSSDPRHPMYSFTAGNPLANNPFDVAV